MSIGLGARAQLQLPQLGTTLGHLRGLSERFWLLLICLGTSIFGVVIYRSTNDVG